MDSQSEQVLALLKEHRAVLSRTKKHQVWKFPDGKRFTMASTPSDEHAPNQQLRELRQLLGIVDLDRGKPGERKPKKAPDLRHKQYKPSADCRPTAAAKLTENREMRDKLLMSGAVESALREKIATLHREFHRAGLANARKRRQLKHQQARPHCWWCRFKRLLRIVFTPWPPTAARAWISNPSTTPVQDETRFTAE